VHEICPGVPLKDEGRSNRVHPLAVALLFQALIERELRQAMARDGVDDSPST